MSRPRRQLEPLDDLTEADFRRILAEDDPAARHQFLRSFPRRLNPIARRAKRAYDALYRLGAHVNDGEPRAATVYLFLHASFNNAISSTHLLVSGFPLASGHLMRQYAEAVTMAMLCADTQSGVFEEFERLGMKYRVDKCFGLVDRAATSGRLRRLVGLDATNWATFVRITKFYHNFSHASAFSLAMHKRLKQPGVVVIGQDYDPAKRHQLSIELKRRSSALKTLAIAIRAFTKVVPGKKRRGSGRGAA